MGDTTTLAGGGMAAIGAQAVLVIGGLLTATVMPPAQGQMLLVPLSAAAAARLPALALQDGTLLVAHGRLPGSLVVRGDRARLGWAMLAAGIVPLASDGAGCTAPTA